MMSRESISENALEALLTGLIDYAGLFPPAALEPEAAIRLFAASHRSTHAWMLGRFVCPMSRLGALAAVASERFEHRSPLELSVILPSAPNRGVFSEEATVVAETIAEFERAMGGKIVVSGLETRLPDDLVGLTEPVRVISALETLSRALDQARLRLPLFLERSIAGDDPTALRALIDAIRSVNISRFSPGWPAWGLKIRCGGLEAGAFPSTNSIARAVIACRDRLVPFRATAGLHHPLPGPDAATGARRQGFLNLFGGALLAGVHGLDEQELVEILEEEEPRGFRFERGHLTWREYSVSAVEVRHFRQVLATSFGSCSFNEPVEDLRELGLL